MLSTGDIAVDFELFNTELEKVKLSQFKGKKVVLVFYPGAFTSVCQKELCAFRDSITNFEKLDAVVLGISVDSPFVNKAFKEQNMISFELLSDYGREVSRMYGGVYKDFAGMEGYSASKRSVFVINPEGIITYSWATDNPGEEPDYERVFAEVEKLN
ncbi:peroxiredoxin [Kosmotoga pacifica]|uniref:Alkyl hydroperoxide reductase n=1 Tax=Kosmotoga pacifica TaxID=1330330 RepID=A0A0G2Z632_9BACT|nr:peroxiredoxin [Kosmotoga pacifica]AKI97065.1 alkyl hydroperoxide reductase [Kosmotoga pacifica]